MQTILKTTLLEYDKSAFLIDIVLSKENKKYIQIQQTILNTTEKQTVLINPLVLTDIITTLQSYKTELKKKKDKRSTEEVEDDEQKQIVKLYLKGVSIKDLSLQKSLSISKIEQILFNKNIEIIDAEKELAKVGKRFWRRRRRK
jgi:hypothetical protein